jgi:hypothetical protein
MADMQRYEQNATRILSYLEDKMTPAEEEEFIRDLGEQEDLRLQYEDELAIQALVEEAAGYPLTDADTREEGMDDELSPGGSNDDLPPGNDLLLQSADDHIDMIEAALQSEGRKAPARIIPLHRRFGLIAAILVAILLGAFLLFRLIGKPSQSHGAQQSPPPVAQSPTQGKNPSPLPPDTAKTSMQSRDERDQAVTGPVALPVGPPPAPAPLTRSDSLYATLYEPYTTDDPPLEIHRPYELYAKRHYAAVIRSNDADYLVMGGGSRNELLLQHMQLYKGLSFLALDKSVEAAREFDSIMQTASPSAPPYYDAQWYNALACLKQGNASRATALAAKVPTGSLYRSKALALLQALQRP